MLRKLIFAFALLTGFSFIAFVIFGYIAVFYGPEPWGNAVLWALIVGVVSFVIGYFLNESASRDQKVL